MDTSKEYIKMCEKAGEIQKGWVFSGGDYYWYENLYQTILDERVDSPVHVLSDIDMKPLSSGLNPIFIPRQDQLMLMCFYPKRILNIITKLYCFCEDTKYFSKLTSMEQLWLAFVMKEKYNKTWDGTDWKEPK